MGTALFLILLVGDDGFRCPDTSKLISVGDSTMLVRHKCRDPDDRTVRTETRRRRVYTQGKFGRTWQEEDYQVEIEEWLYDFSTHRFMRQLRFEDARLSFVSSLGYGSR